MTLHCGTRKFFKRRSPIKIRGDDQFDPVESCFGSFSGIAYNYSYSVLARPSDLGFPLQFATQTLSWIISALLTLYHIFDSLAKPVESQRHFRLPTRHLRNPITRRLRTWFCLSQASKTRTLKSRSDNKSRSNRVLSRLLVDACRPPWARNLWLVLLGCISVNHGCGCRSTWSSGKIHSFLNQPFYKMI